MLLAEISMAKELIVEVTDKLLDILPQSRIFKPFFSLIPCSEICSRPFSTSIRLNSKNWGIWLSSSSSMTKRTSHCSVQFSHSVVSNSLWPHGLEHASLPSPSRTSELAQTHVHRVHDAIQPSHLLSSPSPPAFNLFQHQGIFQWVSSSHQVAKVLEFQLQHWFFQWVFRTDFL